MYNLTTKNSKININVTGEYVNCFAETETQKVYKTLKKNAISSVELKHETVKTPRGRSNFVLFGLLLLCVAMLLVCFNEKNNLGFYIYAGVIGVFGLFFTIFNIPRNKKELIVFLNFANSNGNSLFSLPLGEYNKELAVKVNKIALDVLSSKKPDFTSANLNEVFDLDSTSWN